MNILCLGELVGIGRNWEVFTPDGYKMVTIYQGPGKPGPFFLEK